MQQMPRDARRKKADRKPKPKKRTPQSGRKPMNEDVLMGKQLSSAELIAYDWNPRLFMVAMSVSRGNVERKKYLRQAALWGTQAKAEAWSQKKKWKERAAVHSVFQELPLPASVNADGLAMPGGVWVVANDTLECAHGLAERGATRIAALVMASRAKLGGGFVKGSKAQEEDIYRCTAISAMHEQGESLASDEDLRKFSGVPCFRGSEEFGYPWLRPPFSLDLFSMAAISNPTVSGEGADSRMDRVSTNLMVAKVERLLTEAIASGVEHLILGAWGCGVYACPPFHIADIFRSAIKKRLVGTKLRCYFAIPDRGKSTANLDVFMTRFRQAEKMRLVPRYQQRAAAFELCLCWRRVQFVPKDVLRMIVRKIVADSDVSRYW